MIVDPDFLDHWRTRMLVEALCDEMAPMYVIRIWGHCQQRRGDSFEIPAAGLKALCKASAPAEQFESAMIASGFISRDGETIKVTKWAEKNASLIASWDNGLRGGRPRKEPNQNPRVTDTKPTANPDGTQPKPTDNPTETQTKPIREEKRREEPTEANASVVASKPATPDCPHQEIIALYHEILPMCPSVREWTNGRAANLKTRWREKVKRQDVGWWKRFFEYVSESEFLTGRGVASPGREPFVADIGWLLKPENFAKVIEGKYHAQREAA